MTQQTLRLLIDGFKRGKHQQSYGISIKVGLWAWRRLFYLVEPILQGIEHGRAINCQVHLVSLSHRKLNDWGLLPTQQNGFKMNN